MVQMILKLKTVTKQGGGNTKGRFQNLMDMLRRGENEKFGNSLLAE